MTAAPTQQFLQIDRIKEGVVILKNKALRGVMMVSSLNFALKSDDEQKAIIYQFQSFLNSLDFPVEILIQSRKSNITGYLEKLKEIEDKQENELLKIQTREYLKFIKGIVTDGTIMTKNFFIVIPFTLLDVTDGQKKGLFGGGKKQVIGAMSDEEFARCKDQLWQRMEFIAGSLRRCGLKAVPLNTQELIELFWALHHPEEAEVNYYPAIPPELTE